MPQSSDPAMLLFFGLDQSQPGTIRTNLGSLGSAQDLTPSQASGTDGVATIGDGNAGRALDLFITRFGWTTSHRGLKGPAAASGAVHACRKTYPTASAANDFAYGARLMFRGLNTGGGANEAEAVFGLLSTSGPLGNWGLQVVPDDPTTPTAAKIRVFQPPGSETIDALGYSTTGSPPTFYLLKNEWYRVVLRVFFNSTGYRHKLYVVRESTGALFTFTRTIDETTGTNASFDSATDARVWCGVHGMSSVFPLGGYADECWFYGSGITDTEATSLVHGGFTVPYTPPSYRVADHVTYAGVARDGHAFPKTRALPTGGTAVRYPPDVLANRIRVRVESWRPGRPTLLRSVEGTFRTAGPFHSKHGLRWKMDDLTLGLWRMGGELPPGSWEDARNVEITNRGVRRRRGYQIRRAVAADQGNASANAFYFFRALDGALYGLYKVGINLYEETGAGVTSLDTGWNPQQVPSFLFLDNRAIILSGARRRFWRGNTGSTDPFGVAAGSTATVVTGVGGTLNGSYYYAWTEYDPTTGDESGPTVSAVATPSTQKVTLTMDAVNADTRFSQRRIYRTGNGGSPPDLRLIATIATATTYADTGDADGVTLVGQVTDTAGTLLAYLTGAAPDTFSFGVTHLERAFYSGGATFPERIYPSEANEPARWYSNFYLVCAGPVRALLSWGHRLVAFTDNTVEVFESDWVRDADGNANVQHHTVSEKVGALGPDAVAVIEGTPYWIDRRSAWRMQGSKPEPLSGPIRDLFPYINHGISRKAVIRFNHIRRQVWIGLPHTTLQDDGDRFATVLTLDLDALDGGSLKWCPYELEAPYFGSFDDDLNGLQFGIMDHLGVFALGETYEGDGAQGNEAFTTEDEGGDSGSVGISTIVGSVVTAFGSPGWTTDALRGMSVVLRDRSTGLLYWHKISGNTATTFTVVGTPNAALATRDGYYIGGIRSWVQFAEQQFGSPNEKVVEQVHLEFADLTQTSLYS